MFLKKTKYFVATLIMFLMPLGASAARTLNNPISNEGGGSVGVTEIVGRILQGFLGIAGVLAAAFIIIGGFKLIIGFAQGAENKIGEGKKTILLAILGLIIAFGGYIVVNEVIKRTGFLIGQGSQTTIGGPEAPTIDKQAAGVNDIIDSVSGPAK